MQLSPGGGGSQDEGETLPGQHVTQDSEKGVLVLGVVSIKGLKEKEQDMFTSTGRISVWESINGYIFTAVALSQGSIATSMMR